MVNISVCTAENLPQRNNFPSSMVSIGGDTESVVTAYFEQIITHHDREASGAVDKEDRGLKRTMRLRVTTTTDPNAEVTRGRGTHT